MSGEDCWLLVLSDASQRWNGATGLAVPGSVFDPLLPSAFGKPWSATDDAAVATDDLFLHFFFLIRIRCKWLMNAPSAVDSVSPPFQTDTPDVAYL